MASLVHSSASNESEQLLVDIKTSFHAVQEKMQSVLERQERAMDRLASQQKKLEIAISQKSSIRSPAEADGKCAISTTRSGESSSHSIYGSKQKIQIDDSIETEEPRASISRISKKAFCGGFRSTLLNHSQLVGVRQASDNAINKRTTTATTITTASQSQNTSGTEMRSILPSTARFSVEMQEQKKIVRLMGQLKYGTEEMHQNALLSRPKVSKFVHSERFGLLVAFIIVCHALVMGLEVDNQKEFHDSDAFMVVEFFFATFFLFEISLRMFADGREFFSNSNWAWNVFDSLMALISTYDVYTAIHGSDGSSLSVIRMLRAIRVAKALRIFRLIRMFKSLRVMVFSIFNTLKALGWAVLLMSIILYVYSLVFVQAATDPQNLNALSKDSRERLSRYYPNIGEAMFTLFQSITGGIDWSIVVDPLKDISLLYACLFISYVAFMCFAVMNVVTGHFCHKAIESAQKDQDHVLEEHMKQQGRLAKTLRRIFYDIDGGKCRTITLGDFEECLKDKRTKAFFETLEINASDAWTIFKLLDSDGSNDVDIEEFVAGCLRLRGNAKSVDVASILHRVEWMSDRLVHFFAFAEQEFQILSNNRSCGTMISSPTPSIPDSPSGLHTRKKEESLRSSNAQVDTKTNREAIEKNVIGL